MLNGSLFDLVHDHSDGHSLLATRRMLCHRWWKRGAMPFGGGSGRRGSVGWAIGSDRFRRDGTKGRRPWFYLNDLTLGRSRSSALWGRVEVCGTW